MAYHLVGNNFFIWLFKLPYRVLNRALGIGGKCATNLAATQLFVFVFIVLFTFRVWGLAHFITYFWGILPFLQFLSFPTLSPFGTSFFNWVLPLPWGGRRRTHGSNLKNGQPIPQYNKILLNLTMKGLACAGIDLPKALLHHLLSIPSDHINECKNRWILRRDSLFN
jgi:hypothetical protein